MQNSKRIVDNVYGATERVKRLVESMIMKRRGKCRITKIKQANIKRHRIIEVERKVPALDHYETIVYILYLVYQREPLRYFAKIYNYPEPSEGVGINYEILRGLVDAGVDLLVFVFCSGRIYAVKPEKMFKEAEANGWIRKTRRTKETVVNYPITRMTLLDNADTLRSILFR